MVAVAAPAASWQAFLRGDLDAGGFRAVLEIAIGKRRGGLPLAPRGLDRENAPYLRTDFQGRPLFDFQLGNGTDPFDYTLRVAPEAVMSPFRGALITLQGAIRIHDDLNTFPCLDENGQESTCGPPWIEPERNTLSWGGWLPAEILVAASGGLFPGDRWGFAGELGRLLWGGQLQRTVSASCRPGSTRWRPGSSLKW